MVTFHEIKGIIQKMAALSSHIVELNLLLPEVVQLTEKIDNLNEDLTLERDRMTAKIRSVEVLGEILKTHVYQNATPNGFDQTCQQPSVNQNRTSSHESVSSNVEADSNNPGPNTDDGSQGFFIPNLDGSSMML